MNTTTSQKLKPNNPINDPERTPYMISECFTYIAWKPAIVQYVTDPPLVLGSVYKLTHRNLV